VSPQDEDASWAAAVTDVTAFLAQTFARIGQEAPSYVDEQIASDAQAARETIASIMGPGSSHFEHRCVNCICRQLTIIAHGILRERGPVQALTTAPDVMDQYTRWHRGREQKDALS
jgi:hypothetical protein